MTRGNKHSVLRRRGREEQSTAPKDLKGLGLVLKLVIKRIGIDLLFGSASKGKVIHTLHSARLLSTELRKNKFNNFKKGQICHSSFPGEILRK